MPDTPAQHFDTLRECLLALADTGKDEPLPNVRLHTSEGGIAINGPNLEYMIRAAVVARATA